MAEKEKICPECKGKKVIAGTCTCNMEWRGSQKDDEWDDCHCIQEVKCPVCHGEGVVA